MTLKNLQNESLKVRMTPAEKAAMRAQIFGAPAPTATSTASPYFFFDFQFMSRAVAGVLVFVLVGGSGVAYAAEAALPGQTLYTVKRNVTEPIKTALAPTPAARATVYVELAQRRVEEAEALAAMGALDTTTSEQLEADFEAHAQSADELALEVGATDPSAAVEIKAGLASSLGVHGAILATLANERESGSNKDNSEKFASRVIARANVAAGTPAAAKVVAFAAPAPTSRSKAQAVSTFAVTTATTEVATATSIAATAPAPADTAADSSAGSSVDASLMQESSSRESDSRDDALKTRAENALKKAKDTYDNRKSKLDAEARESLDTQLTEVQTLIDGGAYTDALRLALKLQVAIKAQSKYRTNIITPLFKLELGINENRHGQDDSGDSQDDH